jgi:hypothetical protein
MTSPVGFEGKSLLSNHISFVAFIFFSLWVTAERVRALDAAPSVSTERRQMKTPPAPATPLTATIPTMAIIADVGQTKIRELIRDGRIETVAIGKRRLVVVDSFRRLIQEELNGLPKDARRNDAVPALGSKAKKKGTPRGSSRRPR